MKIPLSYDLSTAIMMQPAATYSSAQFIASSDAIRSRDISFWTRMLLAINGSYDLPGCVNNSEPGIERIC